jgi:hypothetical protein
VPRSNASAPARGVVGVRDDRVGGQRADTRQQRQAPGHGLGRRAHHAFAIVAVEVGETPRRPQHGERADSCIYRAVDELLERLDGDAAIGRARRGQVGDEGSEHLVRLGVGRRPVAGFLARAHVSPGAGQ